MKIVSLLLILISVAACNPVKRAFKPKYIEETKTEFFTRGLCINDTVTETTVVHDSVVIKDTQNIVTIQAPKLEKFNLDTVINGVSVSIQNGNISVSCPEQTRVEYRTRTVTNTIRDLGLEGVLKRTIAAKDSVLLDTKNELADLKQSYYKNRFILWIIGLLIVAGIGFRLYRIFKF